MADHIFHRDGQRAVVAEHGHAEAVADKDHIHACFFLQVGGGVVVASDPGDWLTYGSLVKKSSQGYFLAVGHFFLLLLLLNLLTFNFQPHALSKGFLMRERCDDGILHACARQIAYGDLIVVCSSGMG